MPGKARNNDVPVRNRTEAEDVLANLIEGWHSTDAFHEGEVGILLAYVEQDIKTFLFGQIWR